MSYLFKNISEKILSEINSNYEILEVKDKSKIFSGILYEYLSSDFFDKKYDNFKVIEVNSNDNKYYIIGFSQENDSNNIYDYYGKISPYLDTINIYEDNFNKNIVSIEKTPEMMFIINKIKKDNDFLSLVFETNEIKKNVMNINKKEIYFEIYNNYQLRDNINILIKEDNLTNDNEINSFINKNCNMKHFDINKSGDYFIARNENSIAGIALLVNNPFVYLNEEERSYIDQIENYKYLSYVNVNKEFLGNGIGVKLIEEIYKHCQNNNFVYETSDYTEDGSKYLKNKVEDLNKKYGGRLTIIDHKSRKKSEILISKESKKLKLYEDIKIKLNSKSNEIKMKNC